MTERGSIDTAGLIGGVVDDVNTQFKSRVLVSGFTEVHSEVKQWVPTRSRLLDLALSSPYGLGVPTGKIIEIFGEPSEGKSTLAEEIMCAFQRAGGVSILLDSESAWHRDRAMAIGHDPNKHIHLNVDTVECGFDVIFATIEKIRAKAVELRTQAKEVKAKRGKLSRAEVLEIKQQLYDDADVIENMPIVIVWDTVAASMTEGEKEGEKFRDGIADKPRKIRQALRQLSLFLPHNQATLVFVNQTYAKIKKGRAAAFGPQSDTHGGGAIKFWSSIRIKVWRSGWLKIGDKDIGIMCTAKIVKNKVAPPLRMVDIPLRFDSGFDAGLEALFYHAAKKTGIVNITGSWYDIPDFETADGDYLAKFYVSGFAEKVEHNPELINYLQDELSIHWLGL